MTPEELKDYLLNSELCCECKGRDYYIEQNKNGYAAAPCDDEDALTQYATFDELLDNFLIDGEPLRTATIKITDW